MSRLFSAGRAGVAAAVIASVLDNETAVVTEAEIEAILRQWRVADSARLTALTRAYFGRLRRPENDRPHYIRAREMLAGMGADVELAEREWRASSYVQGNPWG